MKKIGVISDAHGNLPALQVALKYLSEQGCGEIIHTGDVVDIGADSLACLKLLLQHGVTCLMGNHDRDFVMNDARHRAFSHVAAEHKEYVFKTLTGLRDTVAKFPMYVVRKCGGQTIMFEHYCRVENPQENESPFRIIAQQPTAEIFDEMYAHYNCDAVFFGHKHEPCDITGNRLYVDVGSIGCHPEPDACGVIISYDDNGWQYERFAAPYDQESARKKMTDGTLPDGEYLYDFYFSHKKNLKRF